MVNTLTYSPNAKSVRSTFVWHKVGVLETQAFVIGHQQQGGDKSFPSGGCYEDDTSVLGLEILINETLGCSNG